MYIKVNLYMNVFLSGYLKLLRNGNFLFYNDLLLNWVEDNI